MSTNEGMTPGAFDVPKAAVYATLSTREIERAIAAGDLPVKAAGQRGGKRLILRADLDAFLANLPDFIPGGSRETTQGAA